MSSKYSNVPIQNGQLRHKVFIENDININLSLMSLINALLKSDYIVTIEMEKEDNDTITGYKIEFEKNKSEMAVDGRAITPEAIKDMLGKNAIIGEHKNCACNCANEK